MTPDAPTAIERDLEVPNKLGLHARASSKLVQTLGRFRASATLAARGREVNAKSIMGVLLLAAPQGTVVRLKLVGEDAAAALAAVEDLFARRFDEES